MILSDMINKCLCDSVFPDNMNKAEICPVSKYVDDANINNHRPVSILSTFKKVFETIIAV